MENKKTQEAKKPLMHKNNRILLIFVCIFLSIVLIFGSVFGIILAIKEANCAMKLGGVYMDEGVVRVFASYYKDLHIQGLRRGGYSQAEDTMAFWQSLSKDGKPQGEIFIQSFGDYLSGIAAGCNLFDQVSSLTEKEKAHISDKCNAFISYYGSEEEFCELGAKFGFDYHDFCEAMELSYKAQLAVSRVYGYQGANLKAGTAESVLLCEQYLDTYSRVKLLFLSDGKISEKNDQGEFVERDLTEGELLQREKMAQELRDAMAAAEDGGDGAITETMFDIYLEKSDGDPDMHSLGYYFSETGEQTIRFSELYPEVVRASFDMEIGEYMEVDCLIGKCFIYKTAPEAGAYKNEDNLFLSDFYQNGAVYLYTQAIQTLASEAVFKDLYYGIDLLSIPTNNLLFVTDWS